MPSTRKKLQRKLPFSLAIACGCGGPTLSDVYVPRPKHENPSMHPTLSYYHRKSANNFHLASSTSSGCSTTTTSTCRGDEEEEEAGTRSSSYWHSATTSFSQGASTSNSDSAAPHDRRRPPSSSTTKEPIWSCRICRESVAVVKESKDPYLDFHNSMLQMIVEKEIYTQDDLRRLLHCFLSLNSPSNHSTIVHAFCDATSGAGWGR